MLFDTEGDVHRESTEDQCLDTVELKGGLFNIGQPYSTLGNNLQVRIRPLLPLQNNLKRWLRRY